jgi:hypothetical protein
MVRPANVDKFMYLYSVRIILSVALFVRFCFSSVIFSVNIAFIYKCSHRVLPKRNSFLSYVQLILTLLVTSTLIASPYLRDIQSSSSIRSKTRRIAVIFLFYHVHCARSLLILIGSIYSSLSFKMIGRRTTPRNSNFVVSVFLSVSHTPSLFICP